MKIKFISSFNFGILPIRLNVAIGALKFCLLFCFLSTFISNYTFCQKLSPEVISSAGNISKSSSVSLEWTLGETAIESSKSENKHYTQGFHQTFLKVTNVITPKNENIISDFGVIVSPNPVEAVLEIKIITESLPQDQLGKVELFLFNILGQQLVVQKINEKSESTFVDMTTFPSGTYFLKAQKENGAILKSFKIIKIR